MYKCNFCDYQSSRNYNLKVHIRNKHNLQTGSGSESMGESIPPQPDMIKHMKNKHVKKDSMTEDELRNMITESFNVFQDYMKIKMQATGAGSEEMIEESIRAFKCYMLNQINE